MLLPLDIIVLFLLLLVGAFIITSPGRRVMGMLGVSATAEEKALIVGTTSVFCLCPIWACAVAAKVLLLAAIYLLEGVGQ